MARTKKDKSIFMIFFDAVRIFGMNIHKFLLYMAFPILGQILGIFIIFGCAFWFRTNFNEFIEKYPFLNNSSAITTFVIILTLPGILILLRALWDYLVAYGALNSMTEGAITTGKVYDFPAHNAVVKKRIFTFTGLWMLFGIFSLLAVFPLFWVIGGIFFIYFILIFQVFTFEYEITAIECFKKSLFLIKGYFFKTAVLALMLAIIIYLFTLGVTVLFQAAKLDKFFLGIVETWVTTLPLDNISMLYGQFTIMVTPQIIAQYCLDNMIFFLTFGFLLPLRSITWTLWYKNLNFIKYIAENPQKKRKTAAKKLDKNILKRAMKEDS